MGGRGGKSKAGRGKLARSTFRKQDVVAAFHLHRTCVPFGFFTVTPEEVPADGARNRTAGILGNDETAERFEDSAFSDGSDAGSETSGRGGG